MTDRATATQRPPYLKLTGVKKNFGPFQALKGIDLEIGEGELVCFLGPSGCGKTTLLRAIAGLDRQSDGRIVQAGRDISDLPPSKRDFGIVFQSYALFPNLTVFDNIAYGLVNRGLSRPEIAKRVEELARLVHLGDHMNKYPAQLSGGQQQRVALARALALSPGLLLLDEPLSALDAQVRQHLRREIKDVQSRLGVTTIMVTHDQEEALNMADRIVLMDHGTIEQVGTPIDIYRQPASAFVAGFIGHMIFLPAQILADGRAEVGAETIALPPGTTATAGDKVRLAIRPEHLAVTREARAGWNAVLDAVEFCGNFFRLHLTSESAGFATLMVDLPTAAAGDLAPVVGERYSVLVPPGHLHVFPAAS